MIAHARKVLLALLVVFPPVGTLGAIPDRPANASDCSKRNSVGVKKDDPSRTGSSGFVSIADVRARTSIELPPPNDPAYHEIYGAYEIQWPLHQLDATAAWALYPGWYFGADERPQDGPLIAIVGTGVDTNHPDFTNPGAAGSDVSQGGQLVLSLARTFRTDDPADSTSDVTDEHGHGTHLAGIIAAATNNGQTAGSGVAGLAYAARLLPIKVAGEDGVALHGDIARAIVYATDQGADVILVAFSGPTWSQALQTAVDYAWHRGCFIVAPMGDAGADMALFPAACPHVFAVGALTVAGNRASYSSTGKAISLVGAGGNNSLQVYSALPTYACTLRQSGMSPPYGWLQGTAQAAAHIAAAAALYVGSGMNGSREPGAAIGIWQALQSSSVSVSDTGGPSWQFDTGYGALSLVNLMDTAVDENAEGSIVGRVLLQGNPAMDAVVTATSVGSGESFATVSEFPTGTYRIANISPGIYRVVASGDGSIGEWDTVVVRSGCDMPGIDFCLGAPPADALCLTQSMPAAAVRGGSFEVSFRMTNTGAGAWRRVDGYVLRQIAGPSEPPRIQLELSPFDEIEPGGDVEFRLSVPAPDVCDYIDYGWQMFQQGGQGSFGEVVAGTVSVTSFLDVPADHWAVREIEALKEADFAQGFADFTYRPLLSVSRDQMAVYVSRALAGGDAAVPNGPMIPTFDDISREHWAYRYIEFVHSTGVVEGYPEGVYLPDISVDRAQMAAFIARAIAG